MFSGNVIIERNKGNAKFYGRPVTACGVLSSFRSLLNIPASAEPLYHAIEAAESGSEPPGTLEASSANPSSQSNCESATVTASKDTSVLETRTPSDARPKIRYDELGDGLCAVSPVRQPLLPRKAATL